MFKKIVLLLIVTLSLFTTSCGEHEEVVTINSVQKESKSDLPIQRLINSQEGNFYFDQLDSKEQQLYVEILNGLQNFNDEICPSQGNAKAVRKVFQFILNDHPEIYYVNGYDYIISANNSNGDIKCMYAHYTISKEDAEKRNAIIKDYVDEFMCQIDSSMDEYNKVKYAYDYIANNTEYVLDSVDNQNICSVFINGRSVCQGYAKALQYLLTKLNIYSTIVIGRVDEENHAWNLVKVDGAWYYVDVTSGDDTCTTEDGSEIPIINYDYLCFQIGEEGYRYVVEDEIQLPVSTSKANSYYMRTGCYLDTVSEAYLAVIFAQAKVNGDDWVQLKCADEDVYDAMCDYLFNQQKVFSFLGEYCGEVFYTRSNDHRTIFVQL